jgi:hypothetical protein
MSALKQVGRQHEARVSEVQSLLSNPELEPFQPEPWMHSGWVPCLTLQRHEPRWATAKRSRTKEGKAKEGVYVNFGISVQTAGPVSLAKHVMLDGYTHIPWIKAAATCTCHDSRPMLVFPLLQAAHTPTFG